MAQGDSQARGLIVATVAGLNHSHSNTRSEQHVEVRKLGVKTELQLPASTTATATQV